MVAVVGLAASACAAVPAPARLPGQGMRDLYQGHPSAGSTAAAEIDAPAPGAPRCAAPPQRGASAGLAVESLDVPGATPGLRCCAYLRHTPGVVETRLAFFQDGSGIYTTAHGDLDGLARSAGRGGRIAVLSIDKPGIAASADGRPTLDRALFAQHTIADLVACSANAVEAALARPFLARDARLLAHGHSEGAQVWARVLDTEAVWLSRVEGSLLSGLPLEPVRSGAERQIEFFLSLEIDAFRRAVASRNDDYLIMLGMPWRYLEHPTAGESAAVVLERVAARRPGLRIDLFHGDRDRNAPYALVRELVARNAVARAEHRPALDYRLHTYPGAHHQLDARLDSDLDAFVEALPAIYE
jgi:hypothetical protein